MMSFKLSPALKRIVFGMLATALSLSFGPSAQAVGQDRGGADTYYSQMQESFAVAAQIMGQTETLPGLPDNLNQAFLKHKEQWMARLNSHPSLIDSNKPLVVDGAEKAAVADVSAGHVELSLPYWSAHPVSMVQSIVLAVHEAGHLEKIPLTHRELDQLGFALVQKNLPSFFGSSGLQKISALHKEIPPREKIRLLFEDASVPATLDDFSYDLSRVMRWQSCIVYPPKQDVLYSHPVWFMKLDIELAPDSPLFPGGQKLTTLHSTFREGSVSQNSKPSQHRIEQTDSALNVRYYGEVGLDKDRYESWAWLRYEFKKNGDLLVFKMNVDDSSQDSYGFCWVKK